MTKPNDFITSTDYASLKNDAKVDMNLVIPLGAVIPAGTSFMYQTSAVVGTRNAGLRARMKSDRYGDNWVIGRSITTKILVSALFGSSDESYVANLERISPSTIRLSLIISNQSTQTYTVTGGAQTITAHISTFLSPFQ